MNIESNVPFLGERVKYPFALMDVGQSFFAKNVTPRNFSKLVCVWGKRLNRTFRTSKQAGGVRVWRIA